MEGWDLKNVFGHVNSLEKAPWLNINHHKFEILGINTCFVEVDLIAEKLGCRYGQWPIIYLRLSLFMETSKSMSFWIPIVEKSESKPHSWSHSHKSKGVPHVTSSHSF